MTSALQGLQYNEKRTLTELVRVKHRSSRSMNRWATSARIPLGKHYIPCDSEQVKKGQEYRKLYSIENLKQNKTQDWSLSNFMGGPVMTGLDLSHCISSPFRSGAKISHTKGKGIISRNLKGPAGCAFPVKFKLCSI